MYKYIRWTPSNILVYLYPKKRAVVVVLEELTVILVIIVVILTGIIAIALVRDKLEAQEKEEKQRLIFAITIM